MNYSLRLSKLEIAALRAPATYQDKRIRANMFIADLNKSMALADTTLGFTDSFITRLKSWSTALYPMRLFKTQYQLWNSTTRFNAVPAGRRSGKTRLAKLKLVKAALAENRWEDAWFVLAAPTHPQAKRIWWRDIKSMIPREFIVGKPNETELTITLFNGAEITVIGMETPQRVEGRPISGFVGDEYGDMRPQVWMEHVRPALTDRLGWAWFIGVPEGRNHYYDMYTDARSGKLKEWGAYTWTTADVLHLYLGEEAANNEIASAMANMDLLTYQQEYNASFITFEGLAYYAFGEYNLKQNCYKLYDPLSDLLFCFDFNVSPGVAVVCQEWRGLTVCIGEVYIPKNSNSRIVANKLIKDWGKHHGRVVCYGDTTGGAKGSAKVEGSDWDILKSLLSPVFSGRLRFKVPSENPRERVRVNAVNARLKAANGTVYTWIDPAQCGYLVKDLEGVRLLDGGSGEIDKDNDKRLTHISDAFGYYVNMEHPIGGGHVTRSESYG